jgi:hypothetical protein
MVIEELLYCCNAVCVCTSTLAMSHPVNHSIYVPITISITSYDRLSHAIPRNTKQKSNYECLAPLNQSIHRLSNTAPGWRKSLHFI